MKNLLIVNPNSGTMKSRTNLFDIVDTLCKGNHEVTCVITKKRGHATNVVMEKGNDFDIITCCGGDGTLNEVISGMKKGEIEKPLGYIPTGSTNDFANSIGISDNIKVAAKNVVEGEKHKVDVGLWNDRYFSYIASFGAFTAVSYKVPQATKNVFGHFAYILEGITDIGSMHPYHIKLSSKEKEIEDDFIFGAVSNSTSIGGIVKLDEKLVDMNDGFFEIALIKFPKNPNEVNRIIWGMINSNYEDDMFEFFKSAEVKINMDEKINWTLDGEIAKGKKEIIVKNVKDAITIVK